MANFIKYELDDGAIIEIETVEPLPAAHAGDVMRGGGLRGPADDAPRRFSEALAPARAAAEAVMAQFKDLSSDEVEVEFGLTINAEAGNFAVGTAGMGATYRVKLKWKKDGKED